MCERHRKTSIAYSFSCIEKKKKADLKTEEGLSEKVPGRKKENKQDNRRSQKE